MVKLPGARMQKWPPALSQPTTIPRDRFLCPQREGGGEGGKALVLSPWVWSGPATLGCSPWGGTPDVPRQSVGTVTFVITYRIFTGLFPSSSVTVLITVPTLLYCLSLAGGPPPPLLLQCLRSAAGRRTGVVLAVLVVFT